MSYQTSFDYFIPKVYTVLEEKEHLSEYAEILAILTNVIFFLFFFNEEKEL